VNGRSEYGDANLKINYKYLDEFNTVKVRKMTYENYCKLLNIKYSHLVNLLSSDIDKNSDLKKMVVSVNNMIIQLNKCFIENKMCGDEH
jgi:hypothetical protein